MPYRLELLGRVQLLQDDQPVESLAGHRHKLALLAYLALQPEFRAARERLVHLFWPDRDESSARHSLSQLLYEIRKEVGEALEATGDNVRLVPGSFECDAVEFRRAAEAQAIRRAANLYGGPFLEGFLPPGSSEFEHWAESERGQLQRLHRKVCRELVSTLRERGELEEAIAWARRWLAADLYEDEANHYLIELLFLSGDRAGALEHFDRYAKLCAELDVEPLDETRALVDRIRGGEPAGVGGEEPLAPGARAAPAKPGPKELAGRSAGPLREGEAPGRGMAGLDVRSLLERARSGRLVGVLIGYGVASWAVLEAAGLFGSQFGLPNWFFPVAVALLLIFLPVVIATALLQTGPPVSVGPRGIELPGEARGLRWDIARRCFTWKRAILGGLLAVSGLGTLGLGVVWLRNRGRELQPDVVAVMPFHVVGEGVELWREGLVDLLATALDGTGQFRSSDPRAVLNHWRRTVGDVEELPEPDVAAGVAGSLRAGRMILGSLIRTGPHDVRVAADLYSVRWLRKEGSAAVEGPEEEITSLTDRLTVDLLKSVWQGDQVPEVRVSAITTASIPALRAYLEGEQAFRQSRFVEAQEAFTRAVEADSTFAIALYRLAISYGWYVGAGAGEVKRYLVAAARHSEGLPERDSLLILANKLLYVDGNVAAIPLFGRLASRYPDDLEAWDGLGEAYFHIGARAGQPITGAIDPLERALALDSSFAPGLIHLVEVAYWEGDTIRGRRWSRQYLALDSASFWGQTFGLATPLQFGPPEDSAVAAQALDTASAERLGWLRARLRLSSDLPLYERVAIAAAHPRFPPGARGNALWELGIQYLRHGEVARALDLIQQARSLSAGGLDDGAFYVFSTAGDLGLATDSASRNLVDRLSKRFSYPKQVVWLGSRAAREGRLEEARAGLASVDFQADSLLAAGDSVSGLSARGFAWALRGHIAAAGGRADSAIAHLRRGISMMNPLSQATPVWLLDLERYWLAGLLEDRGAEEEALAIYGSLYWTPWLEALGYLDRAELHERRGEREEALRYYARFVDLWADADPHLQPHVQSARRALERLAGERATG